MLGNVLLCFATLLLVIEAVEEGPCRCGLFDKNKSNVSASKIVSTMTCDEEGEFNCKQRCLKAAKTYGRNMICLALRGKANNFLSILKYSICNKDFEPTGAEDKTGPVCCDGYKTISCSVVPRKESLE